MKKIPVVFCTMCVIASAIYFASCGLGYAKITGIKVSVVLPDADNYSDALADSSTLCENDYVLETGKSYQLTVEYTATGGSKFPGFGDINDIELFYDSETFKITPPNVEFVQTVRYELVCLRSVNYAAVIVQVGEYTASVIISAK